MDAFIAISVLFLAAFTIFFLGNLASQFTEGMSWGHRTWKGRREDILAKGRLSDAERGEELLRLPNPVSIMSRAIYLSIMMGRSNSTRHRVSQYKKAAKRKRKAVGTQW